MVRLQTKECSQQGQELFVRVWKEWWGSPQAAWLVSEEIGQISNGLTLFENGELNTLK